MLLLLNPVAHAEEQLILDAIDLNALEKYSAEQGASFMEWTLSILNGDTDFSEEVLFLFDQAKVLFLGELSNVLATVLLPAAVLLLLKLMLSSGASSQKAASLICRLSSIAALSTMFVRVQTIASELLQEFVAISDTMTPVLIAASAFAGAEAASALLNPMTALCANLIQNVLLTWGVAISSASAGIAAAGNISMSIRLKRLHNLLKRLIHWGTGGLLAGFTAILSLQGKLSAGRDSATARTARYAIETFIPIIGGNVSDSLDSLLSAANMVKNALGTSGLLLLIFVCFAPMAELMGITLLLHLSAAITEPLGDDSFTAFVSQFADSVEMLLIICLAAAVLCGLLIGSCISTASSIAR